MAWATSTVLAVAGAGLLGAGAGVGLTSLMSGNKQESGSSAFEMPAAPAAPTMDNASEAARLKAEERRRSIARSKSVSSNPLGLQNEAEVSKKKLLGG